MTRTAPQPRSLVAVTFLVIALLLSACSTSGTASSPETTPGDAGWSSVTTTGAFGDATIESRPERIFALSTTDADMLLAVGIVPIAVPSMPQTDAATGGTSIYPWQVGLYPEGTPKVEASTTELNIEAIAATDPDLIVGTAFFGLTKPIYGKLAEIAPVVHYDTVANSDDWRDSTRKIARAVGRVDAGDAAVATAEATLARTRSNNPILEGKTFNAVISPSADGVWILCSEQDNLGRVMTGFGMELSEYAQGVECDGGKAELSWEKVSDLDADVLWAIPDTADQMPELTKRKLWTSLPAVQRGAVVVVPKTEGVPFALAFPSPLSLVWAADRLAPKMSEAATKD